MAFAIPSVPKVSFPSQRRPEGKSPASAGLELAKALQAKRKAVAIKQSRENLVTAEEALNELLSVPAEQRDEAWGEAFDQTDREFQDAQNRFDELTGVSPDDRRLKDAKLAQAKAKARAEAARQGKLEADADYTSGAKSDLAAARAERARAAAEAEAARQAKLEADAAYTEGAKTDAELARQAKLEADAAYTEGAKSELARARAEQASAAAALNKGRLEIEKEKMDIAKKIAENSTPVEDAAAAKGNQELKAINTLKQGARDEVRQWLQDNNAALWAFYKKAEKFDLEMDKEGMSEEGRMEVGNTIQMVFNEFAMATAKLEGIDPALRYEAMEALFSEVAEEEGIVKNVMQDIYNGWVTAEREGGDQTITDEELARFQVILAQMHRVANDLILKTPEKRETDRSPLNLLSLFVDSKGGDDGTGEVTTEPSPAPESETGGGESARILKLFE